MKKLLITLLVGCTLTSYAATTQPAMKDCKATHEERVTLKTKINAINSEIKELKTAPTPDQTQINGLKTQKHQLREDFKAAHPVSCAGRSHVHRHDRRL